MSPETTVVPTLRVGSGAIPTRSVGATFPSTFATFAALLTLTFLPSPLPAQTQEELRKTPLAPAVEKKLAGFVEKCVEPKTLELNEHMITVIDAIDESVKLTDAEKAVLEKSASAAVKTVIAKWKPRFTEKLRPNLAEIDEAEAATTSWVPANFVAAQLVPGCTLPDELPAWRKSLETVLGAERFAAWDALTAEKRAKDRETIVTHLTNWAARARAPLDQGLARQIDTMAEVLALPEFRAGVLREMATAMMDRLAASELERVTGMFLFLANGRLEERLQGKNANERFEAPLPITESPAWRKIVDEILSANEVAEWEKFLAERKAEREILFVKLLEPSIERTRVELETQMKTEVANLALVLGLSEEREREFTPLSGKAIDAAIDAAAEDWKQSLRKMEESQIEAMKQQGGAYFGLDEEHLPQKQAAWTKGLERLLSKDERDRMKKESDGRKKRHYEALARATLAELDRNIAFNSEQRKALTPIIRKSVEEIPEQNHHGHFSYGTSGLFRAIVTSGPDPDQIRAILDDFQWERWQDVLGMQKTESPVSGTKPKEEDREEIPGRKPEPPDVEIALSKHLYEKGIVKRDTLLAKMMVRVEDAARILSLPPEIVAELSTAAKGAVEEDMLSWRTSVERYTRSAINGATRQNIGQLLQGRRVSYGTSSGGPQSKDIWKSTVKQLLTEGQQAAWEKEISAREAYLVDAMAACCLNMLDQRRRLTAEQIEKLRPLVDGFVREYKEDIRRYLSQGWYMQSYYACLPIAGIPEKDVVAILSPAQWEACEAQDLPQAMMYWGNIKENHDQRVKNGPKKIRREIIFE